MSRVSWVTRNASSRFCFVSLASSSRPHAGKSLASSTSDLDAARTVPVSLVARISWRSCCSSAMSAVFHCSSLRRYGGGGRRRGRGGGRRHPARRYHEPVGSRLDLHVGNRRADRQHEDGGHGLGPDRHGAVPLGGAQHRRGRLVPPAGLCDASLRTMVKPRSALGGAHCVSSVRTPASAPTSVAQAAQRRRCSSTRWRSAASISSYR